MYACVCVQEEANLRGGSLWILTFKADLGELAGFQSVNHPLLTGCRDEERDDGKGRMRNRKSAGAWQKLLFQLLQL